MSVQAHQQMSVNRALKQEIISFQSSQIPNWSSPFSVFLRHSGGIICHGAVLVMSPSSTISGTTGTAVTNYPNLSPSSLLITSFDTIINGVTCETSRGDSQFITNQLVYQDEERLLRNLEQGSYTSAENRSKINLATGKYYFPIQCPLIDAGNFKILSASSEIEFKFNMNSALNCINLSTLGGVGALNWAGAEILLRCTRLPSAFVQNEISQIIKTPKHYLYHRTQYAPYALNTGISNTTLTLSTFNGNLSHLMFIIRENTLMTNESQWKYMPISSFELKDSAGTSLCGGRPVLDRESRLNQGRYFSKSSYLAEADIGTSKSYVYVHSFSADPSLALLSGARLNSKNFSGQETLTITLPQALTAAATCEVFGFQESTLVHSAQGVKILSE